jgi:hypothetical protein
LSALSKLGRIFYSTRAMVNIFDNMFLLLSLRPGISLVFMSYAEGIAHFTELLGEAQIGGVNENIFSVIIVASSVILQLFPTLRRWIGKCKCYIIFKGLMNACQRVNSFQCGSLQLLCSELHFYGKQRRSEQFAWLAGPGIYHRRLNLDTSPRSSPKTHTLIAISYLPKYLLFTTNLDYVVQKTDAGFWSDSRQC